MGVNKQAAWRCWPKAKGSLEQPGLISPPQPGAGQPGTLRHLLLWMPGISPGKWRTGARPCCDLAGAGARGPRAGVSFWALKQLEEPKLWAGLSVPTGLSRSLPSQRSLSSHLAEVWVQQGSAVEWFKCCGKTGRNFSRHIPSPRIVTGKGTWHERCGVGRCSHRWAVSTGWVWWGKQTRATADE